MSGYGSRQNQKKPNIFGQGVCFMLPTSKQQIVFDLFISIRWYDDKEAGLIRDRLKDEGGSEEPLVSHMLQNL